MNTTNAMKLVLIAGLALAVIAAFVTVPYAAFALVALGVLLGFLGIGDPNRLLFLMLAVALATVTGALEAVPEIGHFLTAILQNISAMISAAAVIVIGKVLAAWVT